jgi:hypothetical protein
LTHVLIDQDLALYHAYRGYGTPSAVLVRPDATVGSYVAAGSEAIADLFARVLRGEFDAGSASPLIPGMVAPAFDLRSLDGGTPLVDFLEETVLVFWNPASDSCRAMRRDLKCREADRRRGAPRLVIVSSGDAESSRAEGFTSAVLLDPASQVGTVFGARETPSAVRLGADGRVISSVANGAAAVLAMLDPAPRPAAMSPPKAKT